MLKKHSFSIAFNQTGVHREIWKVLVDLEDIFFKPDVSSFDWNLESGSVQELFNTFSYMYVYVLIYNAHKHTHFTCYSRIEMYSWQQEAAFPTFLSFDCKYMCHNEATSIHHSHLDIIKQNCRISY